MRILQVLMFSEFSGTEKVCLDLYNEICKENKVFLFCNAVGENGENVQDYVDKRVKFINFATKKYRYCNPIYLYKIEKMLCKIAPDVIHRHNTKFLEIMKYMQIFLKRKIPLIFTKHNWFVKKRMKFADIYVGISPETLRICKLANGRESLLIENGISFKTPSRILNEKMFNIVGVGRLEKHKNWQLTIRALKGVKFDYRFYILGQGVYENKLKSLIDELNLNEKVKLVGHVNDPWDYIFSSNIQLLPSLFEGFLLTLIEGIYYCKMVFALDVANYKEILVNDFIVENDAFKLTQKLDEIYKNYEIYAKKFENIKKTSQKYSIENVAQKYIKAYESVIK
ncbi:MAG: glycosyltransferase [Campylobacter sp.]|nr:glycosyltransferase [Campylobacter sp.]